MMKSFRKLEMIRHDLEEQRAKDKICNVTSDQTDFVSMMAKRLSNKRDGSVHNQGNPQLHKSHNVFYLKELDKSKSGNIAKPSKVIPSKGNKFKIIKVKRKTELGMNSKSNSKHLTKLTKMRRKSISSSSESFSYKENSSEKANAKIKESRIPTLSTNQMTMSTQGFLNIPVINMENSKTPTNRNSHKAKDLCSNPLVKNHSSRNTSSIIGRRMGEHLSVVGPQNTKISADCSKSATVKKCPNPRKFSFLQVETNNQSSRIKNPPKSPLKPDLKPIKKPKKTCVVNDIFYSMLRVDDLISSQPASSETHKQMTAIKSYLGRYSDLFKKTQSELLQIEVREADDLSQLSQFFDRIRKELDSKEELLKAKYKSMVNSYETSLSMDFEFLENKCRHLCEVIDSNSQKLQTFTKMKPNSSEEIMNSYNLESILLKEKAGTYKLSHKDFTVQAETSFQCPTVECNFRKVRDLINEINVISHSNPECSNSSRETLGSAKKLENTSKGPDTDCKTHYSVRLDVEHMNGNESSEISDENKRKYIRH